MRSWSYFNFFFHKPFKFKATDPLTGQINIKDLALAIDKGLIF